MVLTDEQWEKALLAARLAGATNYIGSVSPDHHGYHWFCQDKGGPWVQLRALEAWLLKRMAGNDHRAVLTAALLGYRPGRTWCDREGWVDE